MTRGLLKVPPESDGSEERDFDLAYYRSLTTEVRFRMVIERSILLLRLAAAHEDGGAPRLTKRR